MSKIEDKVDEVKEKAESLFTKEVGGIPVWVFGAAVVALAVVVAIVG